MPYPLLEVNELGGPGLQGDSLLLSEGKVFPSAGDSLPSAFPREIPPSPSRLQDSLLLELVQGCGLSTEEAVSLQRGDIAPRQGFLYVRQVKGRRGRLAPLPSKVSLLVEGMEQFLNRKNPYLFQSGEAHLSEEAALRILRKAGREGEIHPERFRENILEGLVSRPEHDLSGIQYSLPLKKAIPAKRKLAVQAAPAYYRQKSRYPSGRGFSGLLRKISF